MSCWCIHLCSVYKCLWVDGIAFKWVFNDQRRAECNLIGIIFSSIIFPRIDWAKRSRYYIFICVGIPTFDRWRKKYSSREGRKERVYHGRRWWWSIAAVDGDATHLYAPQSQLLAYE